MSIGGGNLFSLFGWSKTKPREQPVQEIAPEWRPDPPRQGQRIISFRIDADLDRKLSRELSIRSETRSDFIRNALERALQQDAQSRLRAAHAAISWD
jgi:hypothetical protein